MLFAVFFSLLLDRNLSREIMKLQSPHSLCFSCLLQHAGSYNRITCVLSQACCITSVSSSLFFLSENAFAVQHTALLDFLHYLFWVIHISERLFWLKTVAKWIEIILLLLLVTTVFAQSPLVYEYCNISTTASLEMSSVTFSKSTPSTRKYNFSFLHSAFWILHFAFFTPALSLKFLAISWISSYLSLFALCGSDSIQMVSSKEWACSGKSLTAVTQQRTRLTWKDCAQHKRLFFFYWHSRVTQIYTACVCVCVCTCTVCTCGDSHTHSHVYKLTLQRYQLSACYCLPLFWASMFSDYVF